MRRWASTGALGHATKLIDTLRHAQTAHLTGRPRSPRAGQHQRHHLHGPPPPHHGACRAPSLGGAARTSLSIGEWSNEEPARLACCRNASIGRPPSLSRTPLPPQQGANDTAASPTTDEPPHVPAPLANAPRPLKFRIGTRMIRDALFPIYGPEVHKFFSMGMIKFLVVFVLTITRDVKDTLIVTSCGAIRPSWLSKLGDTPYVYVCMYV